MEKEISSGTMLGIVLIALAVVIGLGFAVFSISKGTANDGVTKVQTNIANISESDFNDYDQKPLTGTQLKAAYTTFEGNNVAILIATAAVTDTAKGVLANLTAVVGSAPGVLSDADVKGAISATPYKAVFCNYNAKLGAGTIAFSNGSFKATSGLLSASGSTTFNSTVKSLGTSGNIEYLSPTSKFMSYLIKDSTGTTIGIAATQVVN